MGPPLNKGIDLRHLLDDVLPSEVPSIGLEDSLKIPSMLIDVSMSIVEEVQRACEMVEEIGVQVEVEPNEKPLEIEHPHLDSSFEHPSNVEPNNVDNVAMLQGACIPVYQGARCSKFAATMTLVNMCIVHGCSNKFVHELFSLLHNFILPIHNCLSNSMYGAKTLCQRVGLEYKKFHACISRFSGVFCTKVNMMGTLTTQNVEVQGTNKWAKPKCP
jgi:hypothetical protein